MHLHDRVCFISLAVTNGAKASILTKEGALPLHYLVRRNPTSDEEVKVFCRSLDALLVRTTS